MDGEERQQDVFHFYHRLIQFKDASMNSHRPIQKIITFPKQRKNHRSSFFISRMNEFF